MTSLTRISKPALKGLNLLKLHISIEAGKRLNAPEALDRIIYQSLCKLELGNDEVTKELMEHIYDSP